MAGSGKPGRHRKYSPLFPPVARERYMHGDSNAQVAVLLGVCPWTILRWTVEHEEFGAAVREGRAAAPEFRISQMPAPPALFPQQATGSAGSPASPDHGEPITKVVRHFVSPADLRNR